MTRIVGGWAGSLTLAVPPSGTRPTSDRVREALFGALDARGVLVDARVLDLYAGSGALGLEALSRGAARVVLVEKDAAAARTCRRNADTLLAAAPEHAHPSVDVVARPVVDHLRGDPAEYDLVLLDPPYDLDEDALHEVLALLRPRLADDAIVIVERSTRSPEPDWPNGISPDRERRYGETTLWWASA